MCFIGYETQGISEIIPIRVLNVKPFTRFGRVFGFTVKVTYPGDLRPNFNRKLKWRLKPQSKNIDKVRYNKDGNTDVVYFFSRRNHFDAHDAYHTACFFQSSMFARTTQNKRK